MYANKCLNPLYFQLDNNAFFDPYSPNQNLGGDYGSRTYNQPSAVNPANMGTNNAAGQYGQSSNQNPFFRFVV